MWHSDDAVPLGQVLLAELRQYLTMVQKPLSATQTAFGGGGASDAIRKYIFEQIVMFFIQYARAVSIDSLQGKKHYVAS